MVSANKCLLFVYWLLAVVVSIECTAQSIENSEMLGIFNTSSNQNVGNDYTYRSMSGNGYNIDQQKQEQQHQLAQAEIETTTKRSLSLTTTSKERQMQLSPTTTTNLGICQVYTGSTCGNYLKNNYVFVSPNITIEELESRLQAAWSVIRDSKDMNANCRIYALPSLCYSVLPICLTPELSNHQYFAKLAMFQAPSKKGSKKDKKHRRKGSKAPEVDAGHVFRRKRNFENKFGKQRNFLQDNFDHQSGSGGYETPTRNTENLQRLCRKDCELLELELCSKEYAIAKRHPTIGQKLPLEECEELREDATCSRTGIDIDVNSEQNCFWDKGTGYRGVTNVTKTGKECMKWARTMREIADLPELAGHNYCRNPRGMEEQPWCYIDRAKNVELCNIPKCAEKMWLYIIMGTLISGLSLFLIVVILCCRKCKTKSVSNIQSINTPNADKNIYGNNSRLGSPAVEMASLLTNHEERLSSSRAKTNAAILRVPQYRLEDVKFVEELGEGAFGKVYKGELSLKTGEKIFVAVKALKENASAKTQNDFKREIELISDLRHDNIVNILGVILKKEPFCMLFEFMSEGDLHEFLISNSPNEGKSLTQLQFLYIALQICDGMAYLASHHYVHRDLAARNCLVGEQLCVKISDFGLSRDIYSSDYYRVQSKSLLPVRWMPSESILYGKFTTESDVWSYGVVLFEIYSYGLQPYYGYSNQEVINMVRSRQLLPCPESCPEYVYNLMKACWDEQPVRRPAFAEIGHRLKVWYQQQKRTEQQNEQSLSSRKGSALSIASKSERKGSMNFDNSNLSVRSSINRSTKSVNTVGTEASLSRRNTADIFDGGHVSMYGDGISLHSQHTVIQPYNNHFGNHHSNNDNDSISLSQRSYSRKNQRSHSINVENRAMVTGSVASIVSESQSSRMSTVSQGQGPYLPPSGRPSSSLKKGCHHMKN